MLRRQLPRVDLARLVDETRALQCERDELLERNHALRHAAQLGWGLESGGSDDARASDAAPAHPPSNAEDVCGMIEVMDARLASCTAVAVFAANPTPAQQEVLREIRSRAAVVTLECIGLMLRCACAVLPSALLRVHVAGLRPREAGSKDSAVDAAVPTIGRVYNTSPLLRFGPVVLWAIGTVCNMLVLFDRFEAGSAHEWLASAAVALTYWSLCVFRQP